MLYKILLRLFDSTPQLDSQLPNHAVRSENRSWEPKLPIHVKLCRKAP